MTPTPKRMYDLVKGDIYTEKLQIANRVAWVILSINPDKNSMRVRSQSDHNVEKNITITNKQVYMLRYDDTI